jgi:hypothetical protein
MKYFGKICARHPELAGQRRNGNCPACVRERGSRKPSREAQRRKVSKWRAANRDRYLASAAARTAAKRAKIGDATAINRAFAALSRRAKRLGMCIDHVVPIAGCRVCGERGEHAESNWQLLTRAENSSKGNRCAPCWKRDKLPVSLPK